VEGGQILQMAPDGTANRAILIRQGALFVPLQHLLREIVKWLKNTFRPTLLWTEQ